MKTALVTGGSGFVGRNLITYLLERGVHVRALARSDAAASAVAELGAEVVRGDLDEPLALGAGLAGVDVVFHAAASVAQWGDEEAAYRTNVEGTQRLLDAARAAGVPRFVHVSTEAVLVGGRKIHMADESWPRPAKPLGIYARTKGEAEARVQAANGPGFATVIVRPRLVWGKGDTTLLPAFIEATKKGQMVWVGGGAYLTSTCHVLNLCEALLKAAERGTPGGIYFVTDGEPVVFREFLEAMLRTQGVEPPKRELPRAVAYMFARVSSAVWSKLRLSGQPPLPLPIYHTLFEEVTVSDARARREIGYVGEVSREEGLREIAEARG